MTDLLPLYIPGTVSVPRDFTPEVGKRYYHKSNLSAAIRVVTSVDSERVGYRVIHAPRGTKPLEGLQRLKRFRHWCHGEFVGEDLNMLDGAIIRPTFMVLSITGEPIFRCSYKRARFYVRKGHANLINENTLQFKDDATEKKLAEIYNGRFTPYFMAVKNDKCVCCGRETFLTRHHVIPKRVIGLFPPEKKSGISNVLFVCMKCHVIYERQQLDSTSTDPYVWKQHFVDTMKPQHLHPDWDIVSVKS